MQQAKECLLSAEKDIKTAGTVLPSDPDWAFTIAYNSMLRAVRALMLSDGYSPLGENHHKTTIDYAAVKLGAKHNALVESFDIMRKKRHHAVYVVSGAISSFEAGHAIADAESLLQIIKSRMKF